MISGSRLGYPGLQSDWVLENCGGVGMDRKLSPCSLLHLAACIANHKTPVSYSVLLGGKLIVPLLLTKQIVGLLQ